MPRQQILSTLMHAAMRTQPVGVVLRDGHAFHDCVREIFSGCGSDVVVFLAQDPVSLADIVRCEPAGAAPARG